MLPAIRSAPHADASDNEGESGTAWTEEKRRKTIRPSPLSSEDATEAMDFQFQDVQGVKRGVDQDLHENTGSVFSEVDEISLEEANSLSQKLESREITCREGRHQAKTPEERDNMYRHLRCLRLSENCRDATDTSSGNVVIDWEGIGPSQTSDWTIYGPHRFRLDLDLYQRIVPTREFYYEYMDWEGYCNTLSNYETDEEYVKYWDEMTKKIKWIEEYAHLKGLEIADVQETGCKQALKIAAGFSHLPLSLAFLGYQEYFLHMRWISACKTKERVYFELWKRVRRQKMTFKDALEELWSNKVFHSCLQAGIKEPWFHKWEHDSETIMKLDPEIVSEDVILEQFTSMLDSKLQLNEHKPYVEFVKKKLKTAQRLGLPDGPDDRKEVHSSAADSQVESVSTTVTCSEGS